MHKAFFKKSIATNYLGIEKEIRGSYPAEVKIKAETQLARWETAEKRLRNREKIESLKDMAEYDTGLTEKFIREGQTILKKNLEVKKGIDWVSLYDDRPFPPFVFKEPAPQYKSVLREKRVPGKNFLKELLFPSVKKLRLRLEKEAADAYEDRLRIYNEKMVAARKAHEEEREEYITRQKEYNTSVDRLQMDFARGIPVAVESLARIILAGLIYPDNFEVNFDALYDPGEKIIVIDAFLSFSHEIPGTIRYNYSKEKQQVTPVEMRQEDFLNFYESMIAQIALSSIHLVFESINSRHLEQVGFNGWLADEQQGEVKNCILTCKVSRASLQQLDLLAAPPKRIFLRIGGQVSGQSPEAVKIQPVAHQVFKSSILSETRKITPDEAPKKEGYQPGDIKQAAKGLIDDILYQIEKDILDLTQTKKNGLN